MDFGILGGLLLCVAALWYVVGRIRAGSSGDWTSVTGEVTHHVSALDNVESGDGSVSREETVYAAVYRFSHGGQNYTVTDKVAREKPTPAVGTQVELLFPNGQPDKAQPPRKGLMMVFAVILVVFIVVLLLAALG
ncbi:MAG TPA: hypothetical protein PKA59_05015 [Chakrabartia sp.]|jgi:hypothetical protein|nr:hypothetical protein [Chakrabartia sp.]